MVIEMNLDILIEKKLSPAQYMYLSFVHQKNFNSADKMLLHGVINTTEVFNLRGLGYILNGTNTLKSEELMLSKTAFDSLFAQNETEGLFWEFFSSYPIKVSGRSGMRMLRPTSQDAKGTKVCKKKYEAYLGVKDAKAKHEHVMKCLEAELSIRRRDNSLSFMYGLEVYLNKQAWFLYEHLLELQNGVKTEVGYGEKLI